MARPKKVVAETKTSEKSKRKNAEAKKAIAEETKPVTENAQNIYSTLRTDSNGVKELVIDWDKLREHIRQSL